MGEYDAYLGVPPLSLPSWTSAQQMSAWSEAARDRFERDTDTGQLTNIPRRTAYIRTSGRSTFRECRRKYAWSDIQRGNREGGSFRAPLWFGTGFHYAMEDYHGYRHFESPLDAFMAYYEACKRIQGNSSGKGLPEDISDLLDLAEGMLNYYEYWIDQKEPLQTFWYNDIPQLEVHFQIPIPLDPSTLSVFGYDRAVYVGTIDRVCIDEYGRLWLLDYKTAKTIKRDHLDLDGQISAYCWGAAHIYPGYEVAGFIYQQHKKSVPHEPEFLKSSRMLSISKMQNTTYALYTNALRKLYGERWSECAPDANIEFVNWLASTETDKQDALICRDYVTRNAYQIENEGYKILMEAMEMLNPELPIYPNPTRDCSWRCEFKDACLMMDDGSDWQYQIEQSTIDRAEEDTRWRNKLLLPERLAPLPQLHQLPKGRRLLRRK